MSAKEEKDDTVPCRFKVELNEKVTFRHTALILNVEECVNQDPDPWRYHDLAAALLKFTGYEGTDHYVLTKVGDPDNSANPPKFFMIKRRRKGTDQEGKPILLVALGPTPKFPQAMKERRFVLGVVVQDQETVFYKPRAEPYTCDHATEYLTTIEELKKVLPLCADQALELFNPNGFSVSSIRNGIIF